MGNDSFVRMGEVGTGSVVVANVVVIVVVVMHTIETCKFAQHCAGTCITRAPAVVGNRLIQRHPAQGLNGGQVLLL